MDFFHDNKYKHHYVNGSPETHRVDTTYIFTNFILMYLEHFQGFSMIKSVINILITQR